MFNDTTARNRAHQEFGTNHYWWLIGLKALPWALLFLAACLFWGTAVVFATIKDGATWALAEHVRTGVLFVIAAAGLFWLKRRWRRGDYRP